jgi:DNA-binding response OmpR family regulator
MSGMYDVEWAARYGDPVAVLQKPFSPAELVAAVEKVLGCSPRAEREMRNDND